MLPKYRTTQYVIFRVCERFGLLPPGCKKVWAENDNWAKAKLLAYERIRSHESVY